MGDIQAELSILVVDEGYDTHFRKPIEKFVNFN